MHGYSFNLFQLLAFVLSTTLDGTMTTEDHRHFNGTYRADILCQRDAKRAGLWGTYSALLSTKHRPLQNITSQQYRHLPVVNTMVSSERWGIIHVYILLCIHTSHIQGHIVSSTWEDMVRWRLRDSPLLTLEGDDIRKGQWSVISIMYVCRSLFYMCMSVGLVCGMAAHLHMVTASLGILNHAKTLAEVSPSLPPAN